MTICGISMMFGVTRKVKMFRGFNILNVKCEIRNGRGYGLLQS
jgi:hypothetical protein